MTFSDAHAIVTLVVLVLTNGSCGAVSDRFSRTGRLAPREPNLWFGSLRQRLRSRFPRGDGESMTDTRNREHPTPSLQGTARERETTSVSRIELESEAVSLAERARKADLADRWVMWEAWLLD